MSMFTGSGTRPGMGGRERPCGTLGGPFLAGTSRCRLVGSSMRPGDLGDKSAHNRSMTYSIRSCPTLV